MSGLNKILKKVGLNPIKLENGMTLDTTLLIKAMFDEIARVIASGDTVQIKGFGTFRRHVFKGRRFETKCIPGGFAEFGDSYTLKFKQSINVKEFLNPERTKERYKNRAARKAEKEANKEAKAVDTVKKTKKKGAPKKVAKKSKKNENE